MISWFERHNKLSWIITIIGAALIFYISSLSFDLQTYGQTINLFPTLYHFFAFFCLCFFLLISLTKGNITTKKFLLGIGIVFLYAITDEIHQLLVPGRHGGIIDVLTDSIGILFAGLIYWKK